jgi:hypothetical protein
MYQNSYAVKIIFSLKSYEMWDFKYLLEEFLERLHSKLIHCWRSKWYRCVFILCNFWNLDAKPTLFFSEDNGMVKKKIDIAVHTRSCWTEKPAFLYIKQQSECLSIRLLSCLDFSSTLNMEATCPSETSVGFELATRYYNTEFFNCKNWKNLESSTEL